jgi:hypothetical protein
MKMSILKYAKRYFLVLAFLLIPLSVSSQIRDWPDDEREGIKINYTESNVPHYTLPDLLTLSNGEKVNDVKTWNNLRRPEIIKLLEENHFGRAMGNPGDVSFEIFEKGTSVFEGKALRKQIIINFGKGIKADLLIYLPADMNRPSPLLLNIGFFANSQTVDDPGIKEGMVWNREKQRFPAENDSPFPKTDVMQFIERGYGFDGLLRRF